MVLIVFGGSAFIVTPQYTDRGAGVKRQRTHDTCTICMREYYVTVVYYFLQWKTTRSSAFNRRREQR